MQSTEYTPLLVAWIKSHLQRTKRLDRPEQQPRLAGVLAHISCWESLDQVTHEELHMGLLREGRLRLRIRGNVLKENSLSFCLGYRRRCREAIRWGRSGYRRPWRGSHGGGMKQCDQRQETPLSFGS